jgi:hypothetical protein
VDIILEFIFQALFEILGEALLELGFASFKEAYNRANRNPVLASAGYLLLGGAFGAGSVWLFPHRLTRPGPFPGISIVLAPVVSGFAMHAFGMYRRAHGHETTNLATFYGGAAFAFGASLVRFIWLK